MRGRDKTSGLEGGVGREDRRMFRKGDISRNEVSMCIRRVASITSLKVGITKEDALCSPSKKFLLAKRVYGQNKCN